MLWIKHIQKTHYKNSLYEDWRFESCRPLLWFGASWCFFVIFGAWQHPASFAFIVRTKSSRTTAWFLSFVFHGRLKMIRVYEDSRRSRLKFLSVPKKHKRTRADEAGCGVERMSVCFGTGCTVWMCQCVTGSVAYIHTARCLPSSRCLLLYNPRLCKKPESLAPCPPSSVFFLLLVLSVSSLDTFFYTLLAILLLLNCGFCCIVAQIFDCSWESPSLKWITQLWILC